MTLASISITLNDVALWILAGAVVGVITGQLMRSKGFGVLGDLLFGAAGAAVANFAAGFVIDMGRYGFAGEIVVAIIGAVLFVVIARLVTSRRRTDVVQS
ncbi:MAG TPA: hypothetical protein VIC85_14000 [Ktedonobacterales bacterium]|jgi:uncharacterized membrane protein YeaQ/YmgE (transglycosylase-associated protein family)